MSNDKPSKRTIADRISRIEKREQQLLARRKTLEARHIKLRRAAEIRAKLRIGDAFILNLARLSLRDPLRADEAREKLWNLMKGAGEAEIDAAAALLDRSLVMERSKIKSAPLPDRGEAVG
jgi:hypothetical protein